jgi:uncharacterized C2H2 Zn-finger protein
MAKSSRRCRICLNPEGPQKSGKMSPIFEKTNVAIEIFQVTQIKIIEQANLPALICRQCSNDLVIATRFRSNAVKADNFFREFTKENGQKVIKDEGESASRNIKTEPPEYEEMGKIEMIATSSDGFENVDVDSYHEDAAEEEEEEVITHVQRRKRKRVDLDDAFTPDADVKCSHCDKTFKRSYIKRHFNRAHSNQVRNQQKKQQPVINEEASSLYCEVK